MNVIDFDVRDHCQFQFYLTSKSIEISLLGLSLNYLNFFVI